MHLMHDPVFSSGYQQACNNRRRVELPPWAHQLSIRSRWAISDAVMSDCRHWWRPSFRHLQTQAVLWAALVETYIRPL